MTPLRWRDALAHAAIAFAFQAAFPRLAHRLRWPTRLGPRGLVAYAAFNTGLRFALWLYVGRMAEKEKRARAELRKQLGREPTEDELLAHLGIACER
jgi:hypothetical protein